jgi:release factor glutamine methyltransferase
MNEPAPAYPGMTHAQALQALRTYITAAEAFAENSNAIDHETRMLAASALRITQSTLTLNPATIITVEEASRLNQFSERFRNGEPIARILEEWEFWGLPFSLSPATLIPRPDSETLVEAALARLKATGQQHARLRLLDLGTGSGCLLIALLSECKLATGLGIDMAEQAVSTAQTNAARNGVTQRARFIRGDWGDGIAERFDLIISNPPYIPSKDIGALDASVREHDPLIALDGGQDGLTFYHRLARDLPHLLTHEGFAVIEIGYDQGESVPALMIASGLVIQTIQHDLAGHPRAIVITSRADAV